MGKLGGCGSGGDVNCGDSDGGDNDEGADDVDDSGVVLMINGDIGNDGWWG